MSSGIDLGYFGVPQIGPSSPGLYDAGGDIGATFTTSANVMLDAPGLLQNVSDTTTNIPSLNVAQDQGWSGVSTPAPDTAQVSPLGTQAVNTTNAWWQMMGFDTGASATINWTGRSPLVQAPSQNTITNITASRLDAYPQQYNPEVPTP